MTYFNRVGWVLRRLSATLVFPQESASAKVEAGAVSPCTEHGQQLAVLGAPDPDSAETALSGDLALITATVAQYSFSDYRQIVTLNAGVPEASDPGLVAFDDGDALGPRATWAARRLSSSTPDVPVSAYLSYARDCLPHARQLDLDDPHQAARFAVWYAADGAQPLRGAAPLGPDLIAALNADAADPWTHCVRITRLMASLGGPPASIASLISLASWWADMSVERPSMDGALAPGWLVAAAVAPALPDSHPFPIGRRLYEIHGGSNAYRTRYDLQTPTGRLAFALDMLLHHCRTPIQRRLFDPAILQWGNAPLDGVPGHPRRLETLLACAAGAVSPREIGCETGRDKVRDWMASRAAAAWPWLRRFASRPNPEPVSPITIVGMAKSQTGLGQNLWMTASAIGRLGQHPTILDSERDLTQHAAPYPDGSDEQVQPCPSRRQQPAGYQGKKTQAAAPRSTVIIHVNADVAPQILCHPKIDRQNTHAIGFLLWELEAIPRAHRLALELLDEIWVPSQFLADVYRTSTSTPVHWVGKAIKLPKPKAFCRRSLGIHDRDTLFLVAFDFHSSVERKNPLAAVRAFQRAFGPAPARLSPGMPRLLVKTTETVTAHWGDPHDQWQAIRTLALSDPRIVVLERNLPFQSLLGLIASADTLVSPHRAEGFGYMPAYALSLGTAVIATDYGGSRDFVNERTGFPVAWTPQSLDLRESILPVAGGFWADVSVEALAETMHKVFFDPAAAAKRAAAGRDLISCVYSEEALSRRYADRLTMNDACGLNQHQSSAEAVHVIDQNANVEPSRDLRTVA
ncbi:MAG: glycosyltransferase [Pseudomonadota bacterium]